MTPTVTADAHGVQIWESGAPVVELTFAQAAKLARQLDAAITPAAAINLLGSDDDPPFM